MKKRAAKKLVIAKETLLYLQNDQMVEPRGGSGPFESVCSFCCPTSAGPGLCEHMC
jgi:hypothetical protein